MCAESLHSDGGLHVGAFSTDAGRSMGPVRVGVAPSTVSIFLDRVQSFLGPELYVWA